MDSAGRPRAGLELLWPGKYDERGRRAAVPRVHPTLELLEVHGRGEGDADRLIEGDNLLALDALVHERAGQVDLAVVDPPFGTGGHFDVVSRIGARGPDGKAPTVRRPAYGDRWDGGVAGLIAMLDPRFRLLHELLSDTGSLYVHLDATVVHAVKLLLDEIFGPECFQRQIVWRIGWVSGFKTRARNWIRNHDVILFYTKHPTRFVFDKLHVPHPPGYRRRDGNPARAPGMPIPDVWNASDIEAALRGPASLDSIQIKSFSTEKTGYATQKNESLLERIVQASSRPGDLVADVFCGSGTTLAVARRLGRRVLGCDASRAAIHIARRRLAAIESTRPLQVWSLHAFERARWCASPCAAAEMEQAAGAGARVLRDAAPAGPGDLPRGRAPIVAWGYRLPARCRAGADGSVRIDADADRRGAPLLVARRELFDPRTARTADAVGPWPRVAVTVGGLSEGRVTVRLHGVHDPALPSEVAAVQPGPLDLVDAWAVQWQAKDAVLRPDVWHVRDHAGRELHVEAGPHAYRGAGPYTLRVWVFDVLHRRASLECTLVREGDGLAVREAWQG